MEEMEADHAVAPHCCYEFQNKNGKVFSAPVHNWKKRGEIFNTWSWDKKKMLQGKQLIRMTPQRHC